MEKILKRDGKIVEFNSEKITSAIQKAAETTNEFFVRKSICQPFHKMKSRQDIIEYEKAKSLQHIRKRTAL